MLTAGVAPQRGSQASKRHRKVRAQDEIVTARPLVMRPVAIPDDMEDRSLPKASDVVTLPRHITWSFPTGTTSTTASSSGVATRGA